LLNALELQRKKIEKVEFVVNGAGAAAMACARLYISLGARYENFIMFDKDGVLHKGRTDLDEEKRKFAVNRTDWTLEKAMKDADVFLGLKCRQCCNS
jgi:malate dehydrogenase (oxaloacetate-decarboxylating)(NADP+)